MGYKPEWQNGSMAKAGQSKPSYGVKDCGSLFHGAKMGYADGGILKGYADGGMPEPLREPTEADRAETTTVADLPELREPTSADRGEAAAPKSFGEAFKSARAGGAKEFEFQGKKYTTEMKGESKPAAKKTSYDIDDGKFMDVKPASAPEKPSGPRYGRGAVAEKASDNKKFSRFSSGGKYVPSTGVVVDKK
jgi:hypothetical protein